MVRCGTCAKARLRLLFLTVWLIRGHLQGEVVILANSSDRDSLNLAAHYARARQIPNRHIVNLRMPRTEEITWKEFSKEILNPLRKALMDRNLISGSFGPLTDSFGRRQFIPLDNKVEYLAICRGVPLKLKNELSKVPLVQINKTPKNYRKTTSSVDAELALLASENQQTIGWIPNPLFKRPNPGPFSKQLVIKVSRLDGPSQKAALQLVDSALDGETAAFGRAYVDSGGPHNQGNDWMKAIIENLQKQGFPTDIETTSRLFQTGQRFDAPILYFGWHSHNLQGPFSRSDIKFPPGALAFHIHSFSAQSLRSDTRHWVGPLVEKGVTGTIGNITEPYLHLTHHLPILLDELLSGKSLAEAAYTSLPVLSWQAVLIGDPLYKPALLQSQIKLPPDDSEFAPFHLEQYSAIRWIRLSIAANDAQTALKQGRYYLNRKYGLPLALELAEHELQNGQGVIAGQLLKPAIEIIPNGFQEAGVLLLTADLLKSAGYLKESNQILFNLRRVPNLPAQMTEKIR